MATFNKRKVGYGLSEPLSKLATNPVEAKRAPKTTDQGSAIGQLWVNKSANASYILTSVAAGSFTWKETLSTATSISGKIALTTTDTSADAIGLTTASGGITLTTDADIGITVSNGTQSAGIYVVTGDPGGTLDAPSGSICMRTDTTSADTKLYVNHSNGSGTTWTALTST